MPEIWRQQNYSKLSKELLKEKQLKDTEYEQSVQNISKPYYAKKHTVGVTAREAADYEAASAKLWKDYWEWAKASGLYVRVSLEQQLSEAEATLLSHVDVINQLRVELGRQTIDITKIKPVVLES